VTDQGDHGQNKSKIRSAIANGYLSCGLRKRTATREGKLSRGIVMWLPDEKFFIKTHVAASIATLVCCVSIIVICLVPSFFPSVYRLLVDDRIGIVIPYLLFIALGESIFSIWYFLIRK
jgi:hypothetical protein